MLRGSLVRVSRIAGRSGGVLAGRGAGLRWCSTEAAKTEEAAEPVKSRLRIYTKTGDKGQSSLYTGERRPKHDPIFETLGAVDELNSYVGVALATEGQVDSFSQGRELERVRQVELFAELESIQRRLLDVGSVVATPAVSAERIGEKADRVTFPTEYVQHLEAKIDEMDDLLEPLKEFIMPGGGTLLAAQLHVCRSVCRRAERKMAYLISTTPPSPQEEVVLRFLNRLSDFFFVAARLGSNREVTRSSEVASSGQPDEPTNKEE